MMAASARNGFVFTPDQGTVAQSRYTSPIESGTMEEREPTKPPHNSGYPEPRPEPAKKHQKAPDAESPHEPQNVPSKKPYHSSG